MSPFDSRSGDSDTPPNIPNNTEARDHSGRLLAMGDIHGCAKPLHALLDAISVQADDTLVILGDFINRGPATREVFETLLQVAGECQLVLILGNHEEELLAARHDPSAFQRWLSMGGLATLASYDALYQPSRSAENSALSGPGLSQLTLECLHSIPTEHWNLLGQARDWWECGHYFFTHAGYVPGLPLAEQPATELRWLSLDDWAVEPHCSGKTAIVGHTPNLNGRVVDFGFLRCLDTGCGLGGYLTAMDIRTGQQWRCPEDGEKVVWE